VVCDDRALLLDAGIGRVSISTAFLMSRRRRRSIHFQISKRDLDRSETEIEEAISLEEAKIAA